jgi:hypothetical protein
LSNKFISDLVTARKDVESFILKVVKDAPAVMQTVTNDEELLAPVIEEFVPGSGAALNLAMAFADKVAEAIEAAGPSALANGLNVPLNAAEVAAWKAVIASAKALPAVK